jgi:hypothetical protein
MLPESLACLKPIIIDDLKRYGRRSDGGYLLPTSRLNEIDAVASFGMSDDWSLEKELSTIHPTMPIHVYDHTVSADMFHQLVKSAKRDIAVGLCKLCLFRIPVSNVRLRIKVYQSRKTVYQNYKQFFPARAKHFGQRIFNRHEKEVDATIDDVFDLLKGRSHIFVKMDGGEYRVIAQLLKYADGNRISRYRPLKRHIPPPN